MCLCLCLCLSVNQPFKGDYLEISKNPKYQKLNSAVDEKVLLADVVNKINRANGKVRKIIHTTIYTIFSACCKRLHRDPAVLEICSTQASGAQNY